MADGHGVGGETPAEEIPMPGGSMTPGVVRIGDTIRRPVGRWTPAVHALLRHLEDTGFEGVPRVLGIDEAGREVLTYLPSDPTPSWSDDWPHRAHLIWPHLAVLAGGPKTVPCVARRGPRASRDGWRVPGKGVVQAVLRRVRVRVVRRR